MDVEDIDPGLMARLRSLIPFVPADGWGRMAEWPGFTPPLFHVLGAISCTIVRRDSVVDLIVAGAQVRVGMSPDGPHVIVWRHREVLSRDEFRYIDVVLLRHSDGDGTVVFHGMDMSEMAESAIELATSIA